MGGMRQGKPLQLSRIEPAGLRIRCEIGISMLGRSTEYMIQVRIDAVLYLEKGPSHYQPG